VRGAADAALRADVLRGGAPEAVAPALHAVGRRGGVPAGARGLPGLPPLAPARLVRRVHAVAAPPEGVQEGPVEQAAQRAQCLTATKTLFDFHAIECGKSV